MGNNTTQAVSGAAAPRRRRWGAWSWPALLIFMAFFPATPPERPVGSCDPTARPFTGYSFLLPDIINKNSAYAPFFVRWQDYYEQTYFNKNIQVDDNLQEWKERFCGLAPLKDVEYVVYRSSIDDLIGLRDAALEQGKGTALLPFTLSGNSFAEVLALNGCTEAIDYLMFAKKCEPYVTAQGDGWQLPSTDQETMQQLIEEGKGRFLQTRSHFFRLRYTYQIVRLAHYARQWQQTVDLYNYLIPKVDRKRPSIVYYWTIGHLAGALQQLGKIPEAAYRYSVIFRNCPSKRVQAFRSFRLRNDQDWEKTLRMCQDDAERATLYLLRSGSSHTYTVEDLETIYDLDRSNPQLDLLLVSDVQQLEKIFLRTPITDKKNGLARAAIRREKAAQHLLSLQHFVHRVVQEEKTSNLKLWRAMYGYLELLAGDRYAAEKTFERARSSLDKFGDYDDILRRQLDIWTLLLEILTLDGSSASADQASFRSRSYDTFKAMPSFEPFLSDFLSTRYAESKHPGKALLAAYEPSALMLNPNIEVLDDLLQLAASSDPILLERAMQIDTNPDLIKAHLLEVKGAYLFSIGQPEAALSVLRQIPASQRDGMARFSPFKEVFVDVVHRPVTDSLLLTRQQVVAKILDFEFKAKAAVAMNNPVGAWYFYLIGLGYYNMSYFGYEWEVTDFYRSGYNWLRLPQGPVFPLRDSPDGNRENTDLSLALSFFEKAMAEAQTPELAARATFMAARCRQKQWFCSPDCRYLPGSKTLPLLPEAYRDYYDRLGRYKNTAFYQQIVKECKWLSAYVN
ncbi:MAG: hypothetical protein IT260_19205 [Saprospiraceae bacterium]|nr:hypothetical protein [Saprospiraceae bacterium]